MNFVGRWIYLVNNNNIIYISPSIDPLQGQRPTGCGSSQGTLSGYKE